MKKAGSSRSWVAFALVNFCSWLVLAAFAGAQDIAVTTRHAPSVNGNARVEGSVQMLLGENVTLNGGATLTQDLLVPGTPTVTTDGNVTWQGVQPGTGSVFPNGYQVEIKGGASLRYVRTRTDAVTLPTVPAPPPPTGTQNVTINQPGQTVANWATVRDLTVTGNAGAVAVPPGTYRELKVNGGGTVILGVAGATAPAVYNLQKLTLNGNASIQLAGPVILNVNSGFSVNGQAGTSTHPEWLQVRVVAGSVDLNGGARWHCAIVAPSSTVKINGQAELCGTLVCDRLNFNGGGLIRWCNTTLGGGNRPPIANSQSVTTAEDTPAPLTLTGSDPDGNTLAYTVTVPPQHGTLSGLAPNFTYTPVSDYHGTDSFSFTVNDGSVSSASAQVTVTVTPVNDGPIANPQTVVATEDTVIIITLTGSDVDGDILSYSIVQQPALGSVVKYTGAGAGPGDFEFTPAANSIEPVTFRFRATDPSGAWSEAQVNVTIVPVDDVPVASALSATVAEDGELPITLVGLDPDGELLTFEIIPGSGPSFGTLTGSGSDYIYRPSPNVNGTDTFSYRVLDSDGTASVPALVTITVTPVDDAPTAQDGVLDLEEDAFVAFSVVANDVDGETLSYQIVQPPQHGTLDGAGPAFVYTPNPNYFGDDSFVFRAVDAANPDALSSANATITFHVASKNDAPVAEAQGVTTSEDTPITITLAATDVDGDPLNYRILSSPADGAGLGPDHGTLTPTEDPRIWLYSPAANYTGNDRGRDENRVQGGVIAGRDCIIFRWYSGKKCIDERVDEAKTRQQKRTAAGIEGIDHEAAAQEIQRPDQGATGASGAV